MNMISVIKVNNTVCERINNTHAILHGKQIRICKKVYITRHIFTGQFHAIKLKAN